MSIFTDITKLIAGGHHPKAALREDTQMQLRFFAVLRDIDPETPTKELLQKWKDLSERDRREIAEKWHAVHD